MVIRPKLVLLLVVYVLLASLYLLFVPPWQGADEPTHFEQVKIRAEKGLFGLSVSMRMDPVLQQQIILTMEEFHFWRYVGTSRPVPLPSLFAKTPFLTIVASQRSKPQLYYRFAGLLLRLLPSHDIIAQMYFLRFLSLALSVLSLIMLYNIGNLVLSDSSRSLIVVAFILFLPQFLLASTNVNNDSLFLAAFFSFLYALFRSDRFKNTLSVVCTVGFWGLVAIATDKVGIMVVPIIIYFLWLKLSSAQKKAKIMIFSVIAFVFLILVIVLNWWIPAVGFFIAERFSQFYLMLTLGKIETTVAKPSFLNFLKAYFNSFVCSIGWMRYSLNPEIYRYIYVLSSASIIGYIISHTTFFKRWSRKTYQINYINFKTLIFSAILLFIFSIIVFRFKGIFYAQGRYLFPVIWPIGYIFCCGIIDFLEGFKIAQKRLFQLMVLVFFMFALYAFFSTIIPAFHIS